MVDSSIRGQSHRVDTDPLPELDVLSHRVSFHLTLHLNVEDLQRFGRYQTKQPHTQHYISLSIINRVRTILVLGYWILGNIPRYWVVLVLGNIFAVLTPNTIPIRRQSAPSCPHASE